MTGTRSEMGKIAALAERAGPGRVQLNTVTRPPAESSARPVPVEDQSDLASLFSPDVDIVGENTRGRAPAGVLSPGRADDILALLRRSS